MQDIQYNAADQHDYPSSAHVKAFISLLHDVTVILFAWPVNLSHSSEVSQLCSPRPLSTSAGNAELCQAGVGAFRPVSQPMLHSGLYYVLWK